LGIGNAECGSEKTELGSGNAEFGITEGGNGYDGGRESGFAELKRAETPSLPLSERHGGFSEVELCFSDEQVKEETHRCLQCDLEICLVKEAGFIQKN
jgi:hypothetical protein